MTSLKSLLLLTGILLSVKAADAQLLSGKDHHTKADTLRGMLTSLRTCYNIDYYHLDVKVNIDKKFISGSNLFRFTATQDFKRLQFDLYQNLKIEKVEYKGKMLKYSRLHNAVFVDFPSTIKSGARDAFTVFYSGYPTIALNAPWDGGFVFSKDAAGKPWVGVAVQGAGASLWWPNKDHQADEADSMDISVSVPKGLMNVSNGRLRSKRDLKNGYMRYNWFVSSPINNYNVTLNIADYVHFADEYSGEKGRLTLDYFVLKENLEKAKTQFTADVKPMLKCFEHWFGPYPFYKDGYKLIETPYLGMEHQSAVAYGNKYMKGYLGKDLSGTGLGLDWDYIIVHESGHEWFGNNITSKDIADMWIHEGFTMYSESLFIECAKGKDAAAKYISGIRAGIQNEKPLLGPYNVNKEGSGDMYYKGANMLHTIRTIINNDETWLEILRGLNKDLGLKTTTTEEVVSYINTKSGKNLTKTFDQYLRFKDIPVLEIKNNTDNSISYRWKADVKGFDMPVRIKQTTTSDWILIQPGLEWKTYPNVKFETLLIDTDNFYIKSSIIN
ncbi:MAG TPA: M1 family metallopeptidase [Sphingobacteriaceae bacterium]|nr:M1 family metallopeptidase [Sphingobacteriaceae bacterium]